MINTIRLAFGMPGPTELIIILIVLLLLFGAKRLPELSRSLGRSINEFKRGKSEGALDEGESKDAEAEEKDS